MIIISFFIKKIVNIVFVAGIFTYFVPCKTSKTVYNCIIICFTFITLLNTLSEFNFKTLSFDINNKLSIYQIKCKSFKEKYNIFFDNIKISEDDLEDQN